MWVHVHVGRKKRENADNKWLTNINLCTYVAQYASQNAICFIQATRKSLLPRIIVTLISASYFGALKTVFMHSHAIHTRVHF